MIEALVGAAVGELQRARARKSAKKARNRAESRIKEAAAVARKRATKAAKVERKRATKAARTDDQRGREAARATDARNAELVAQDRAYAANLAAAARQQSIEDAAAARATALSDAARARAVSLHDEANQFVRLRAAAEKAGFNPLTALASGMGGAAIPTGVLSDGPGSGPSVVMPTFVPSYASSGYMPGSRGHIGQMGGEAYGREFGLGLEAARSEVEAGIGAYNASSGASAAQDANTLGAVQAGLSWSQTMRGFGFEQDRLSIDRERLELDRSGLDLERQRTEAELRYGAAYSAPWMGGGARLPAMGSVGAVGGNVPVIGNVPPNAVPRNPDGTMEDRNLAGWGPFDVLESWSPAEYWEEEYSDGVAELYGWTHAGWDLIRNVGRTVGNGAARAGVSGGWSSARGEALMDTLGGSSRMPARFRGQGGH